MHKTYEMGIPSILAIAIGLSMDSLAVSITSGAMIQRFKLRRALKISIYLAVFQGVFPVLGWVLGAGFSKHMEKIDHWVAFILLVIVGGKMLIESFKHEEHKCFNPTKTSILISMAIATSIDAAVVGVGFGLLKVSILIPFILITLTTFIFSMSGIFVGTRFGERYKSKAEFVGGIVLIGLGTKTLIEHMYIV